MKDKKDEIRIEINNKIEEGDFEKVDKLVEDLYEL